jgi:hypothetical protein
MEQITVQSVAEKLTAYVRHELDLSGLVDWAGQAMMEGQFAVEHYDLIREVVGRLRFSDVKAFGVTWEDCELFALRWSPIKGDSLFSPLLSRKGHRPAAKPCRGRPRGGQPRRAGHPFGAARLARAKRRTQAFAGYAPSALAAQFRFFMRPDMR